MSNTKQNMPVATTDSKTKKKKKNNKKKAANANVLSTDVVGSQELESKAETGTGKIDDEQDESEQEAEESDAPTPHKPVSGEDSAGDDQDTTALANGVEKSSTYTETANDPTARFDLLVKDRDALRVEVQKLRQSLEQLQSRHKEEIDDVQKELQDTQGEKEHAEEQYQNLLGKVNTIRSQLGERLKADAEDLAQARTRIEELEEQRSGLQEQYTTRSAEVDELTSKTREQEQELAGLRSRSTLAQQNWAKERDELIESEAYIREEFENAKQAMHDWEVLAMEERQIRRDLSDRVSDMEEQLATVNAQHERAASERDTHSSTVDGLQKAMQQIQEARRKELREVVESSQTEIHSLQERLEDLENVNEKCKADLETTQKELDRAYPFEKEVKEKNLLIGKLRHEAVILNDHLTKALRFLKKGKPEDNVDRQIVTNHFLHFLALDRSDPKKFQILQLIAALLNWTDEQKEQAGLSRPGGGSNNSGTFGSLRLPSSPLVHRTPSTPALGAAEYFSHDGGIRSPDNKESLAELWQNFLEQEASTSSGTSTSGRTTSRTVSSSTVTGGPPSQTPQTHRP